MKAGLWTIGLGLHLLLLGLVRCLRWRSLASNCFLEAIVRLQTEGGHVVVSRSRYGWWLHADHTLDFQTFTEFVPHAPKRRRTFPPILFPGRVETRVRP